MMKGFGSQIQLAKQPTLGDNVADSLREAIFGGVYEPGQRLIERDIASQLKVSRGPVRDAFARLEQEGLVRRTTNEGVVVPLLSHEDMEEVSSLRLTLEVWAIRLAVRHASEENLARLENIRVKESADTAEQLALLDLQFHEQLIRSGNHGRLLTIWFNLRSQIRLIMVQRNLGDTDSRRGTVEGHAGLLGAIRDRDEGRAAELMEQHLHDQYQWFISNFASLATEKKEATLRL